MKNNFMALVLAIFVLIASSGIGSAADIIVNNGDSIQAAVNNATAGDRVIVQPGTYNEDGIAIEHDGVTLMSKSGSSNTVINGEVDVGYYLQDAVINGFTFTGNRGVCVDYADCNVKNCKFVNCQYGIIANDGGNVFATNNQFIKCDIGISSMPFSSVQAENNKFVDCGEAIFDAGRENTVIAKNNEITHTGESNDDTTAPVNKPEKVIPTKPIAPVPSTESNVQAKDITQIIAEDKNVTVNFTNNTTCVESISFTSDEIIGKILAIVEELENKFNAIPEGEIYKFFNISLEADDLNCIRNASVNFSVNNSWIQDNDINQSSIALNEYNNTSEEWDRLQTNITGNDSQAVHCIANVSNYSSFAITANESNVTDAVAA